MRPFPRIFLIQFTGKPHLRTRMNVQSNRTKLSLRKSILLFFRRFSFGNFATVKLIVKVRGIITFKIYTPHSNNKRLRSFTFRITMMSFAVIKFGLKVVRVQATLTQRYINRKRFNRASVQCSSNSWQS